MPTPLPPALRRLIRHRADRGRSAAALAAARRPCPRTARHLLQA